jgi:hypothetical protein
LIDPLLNYRTGNPQHMVVVLDGLDEMGDPKCRADMLNLLAPKLNLLPFWCGWWSPPGLRRTFVWPWGTPAHRGEGV